MTTYPKRIRREHIRAAIEDLGLDAPVYHHRVVGGRLELHTAAGVHYWPPLAEGVLAGCVEDFADTSEEDDDDS